MHGAEIWYGLWVSTDVTAKCLYVKSFGRDISRLPRLFDKSMDDTMLLLHACRVIVDLHGKDAYVSDFTHIPTPWLLLMSYAYRTLTSLNTLHEFLLF